MSHDFFKKLLVVIEGADDKKDSRSTLQKKLANESKVTESTARASNTKDSALDFFRKYSDIISEAEQTDKSDKKWYVDSKSGDRKAGPFDSEVEASDHLAKLKKNNTEEDTKGFELVNESVAIKKSGKKVNEAVRAVVKTSTGQFARPDGQDQRNHVAGMIKGNRAANRDAARKLLPDDRRGSSSATHPESNDGSRGAFQGGAGTAHAVKETQINEYLTTESDSTGSFDVTSDDIEQLFNDEYASNITVYYSALINSSAEGDKHFFVSYDDGSGLYLVNSITISNTNGEPEMVDHGSMPEDEFEDYEDAVAYINANRSTQQTPVAESTRIWVKNK